MFDGALGHSPASRGRIVTGFLISVGAHAALLAAAFLISGGKPEQPAPKDFDVVYLPRPRSSPPMVASAPAQRQRPARRPEVKAPSQVKPLPPVPEVVPPPEPPATPEAPVSDATNGVIGARVGATTVGPAGDGPPCEGDKCTDAPGEGPGGEPGVYEPQMTRPVLLDGDDPVYTQAAREAHVEGVMIVKCVITVAGNLERCRIIKGLPHMEDEVLRALGTRRYKAVTLDGAPLAVNYVFHIQLRFPR